LNEIDKLPAMTLPADEKRAHARAPHFFDPEIDAFNYPLWIGILLLWAVAGGIYSSRVYDFRTLSYWLALTACWLRAFVAAALAILAGDVLKQRWGRFGESCAHAAFLLTTILVVFSAIFLWMVGIPLSGAIAYLLSPEGGGLLNALTRVGLPSKALIGVFVVLTGAAALGAAFLAFSRRYSSRKGWRLRTGPLVGSCYLAVVLILLEQILGGRYKNPYAWLREQSTFPLYVAVTSPRGLARYPARIVPLRRPDQEAALDRPPLAALKTKKDAFVLLVVVESLRADFVTPEIMPNLAELQKESIKLPLAFSNANVTFLSWQAILNSQSPVYPLGGMPDLRGSPAYRLLHEAGFQNDVFSSDLDYFNTRDLAFGGGKEIAEIFEARNPLYSPENDRLSVERLIGRAASEPGKRGRRRFFTLFLDSTHASYRWPADFPAKFKPYLPLTQADYISTPFETAPFEINSRVYPLIVNRYKNSLHFVDGLIGEIVRKLRTLGLYDQAAIIVVGDHGEEFGEHHSVGHASNLYNEQTRIPLIMKLPGVGASPVAGPVSQVDILPTLLDYLGLGKISAPFLGGRSLLRKTERPVLVVALSKTNEPRNLSLNTGQYKFDFLLERSSQGEDLSVWRISDLNDRVVVPGKGLRNDYRDFLEREFVPQLNATGVIAIPRP
jgi:hypothetical protein